MEHAVELGGLPAHASSRNGTPVGSVAQKASLSFKTPEDG